MQAYFCMADMNPQLYSELLDMLKSHLRVRLLINLFFVGDQHAWADRATYVHVWMERVCMAANPHQLWLHI